MKKAQDFLGPCDFGGGETRSELSPLHRQNESLLLLL